MRGRGRGGPRGRGRGSRSANNADSAPATNDEKLLMARRRFRYLPGFEEERTNDNFQRLWRYGHEREMLYMHRRGGSQSRVGTDDRAALVSNVAVDPWPAAVELFHPENHRSLLSTDDIQQRERDSDRRILHVTEALASMNFPQR